MSYHNVPTPARTYGEVDTWFRYDKKFAYLPVKCSSQEWVWMTTYYTKWLVFSYKEMNDVSYPQGCLTEADVLVEKLIGHS
jgi:hypothetical protein